MSVIINGSFPYQAIISSYNKEYLTVDLMERNLPQWRKHLQSDPSLYIYYLVCTLTVENKQQVQVKACFRQCTSPKLASETAKFPQAVGVVFKCI